MSLIEVGTSETGTTVLLISVNEQTYLVVSEDGCEQGMPPTLLYSRLRRRSKQKWQVVRRLLQMKKVLSFPAPELNLSPRKRIDINGPRTGES